MSIETVNIDHIRLESMAMPTDNDMKIWNSLSHAEKKAVLERELEAGMNSGIADDASLSFKKAKYGLI